MMNWISLGQLSCLQNLSLYACKKLEVLPELPPSIKILQASQCISLQEPPRLIDRGNCPIYWYFHNCPKMFGNVTIDSHVSMFLVKCLGFPSNIREFFGGNKKLGIISHGKRIPRWFTNKSKGSHIKVELPRNWCCSKFKGFGICVVLKVESYYSGSPCVSVNNFDGALIEFLGGMIHMWEYQRFFVLCLIKTCDWGWEKAKNFVTFTFGDNNEDVEVEECGVRLVYDDDEDLKEEEETVSSIIQNLPTTKCSIFLEDGDFRTQVNL